MQVKSYDLSMDVDFAKAKYSGTLVATLETELDLEMDAVGLKILKVSTDGRDLRYSHRDDKVLIETGSFNGPLKIEYEGTATDLLTGLYKAPYEGGYFLSTQFEAAGARRMFPCVDNPGYKAEFALAVSVADGLSAISNMPVESSWSKDGKTTFKFKRTPRMSTYLLYLGIGRFEESKDSLGSADLSVATQPGMVQKGAYSLEVAKRAVAFFETYFDVKYMLPKLHLLAIPEFAAGAMENWGAITFRESALLVDNDTSISTKKWVVEVVAHELAHQWFGDLVTMAWWNDLWLNESFATFMASKAMAELYPNWRNWEDFLSDSTAGAMSRDSLLSTHPIEVDVKAPSEVEQIFDAISYGKGASILRMIDAYVGPEQFRRGVSRYLKEHSYANATGHDLWQAIGSESAKSVDRIMSEWVTKPGYPEVLASISGKKLMLKQKRFLASGASAEGTWPIPLTMRVDGKQTSVLMEGGKTELDIGKAKSLKLNVDQTGFYRVHYEGALLDKVWKDKLSDFDKWGLISDATAFLVAGRMKLADHLKTVKRFTNEKGYLPASEVSDALSALESILPSAFSGPSRDFHRAQLKLLKGKTDENSVQLRGRFAARLAQVDDSYAKGLGRRYATYERVEPDMKDAVAVAFAVGYGDYEALLSRYRVSPTDEDKVRHLAAMTRLRDPALVALTLGLALSGEVKRQNVGMVLGSAAANPASRGVAWLWLKSNVDKVRKMYEGTGVLPSLFLSVIPMVGLGRAQEVGEFFAKNTFPEADKGIQAGLERLKIYDRFVRANKRQNPARRRRQAKAKKKRRRGISELSGKLYKKEVSRVTGAVRRTKSKSIKRLRRTTKRLG